ncbi:MAG: CCA tRNA nucleotidyltransferase, partial [Caldilinea sp.]
RYRSEWQAIRPELTGDDLQHLGIARGAIYRRLLAELRAGRLDGTIQSRADEIAWVQGRLTLQ